MAGQAKRIFLQFSQFARTWDATTAGAEVGERADEFVLEIGSRGYSDRIFLVKSESPGNITWCASNSCRVWAPVPNRGRVFSKG